MTWWLLGVEILGPLALVISFIVAVTGEDDAGEMFGQFLVGAAMSTAAVTAWPVALPAILLFGVFLGVEAYKKRERKPKKPGLLGSISAAKKIREAQANLLEPASADDPLCTCPKCKLLGVHQGEQVEDHQFDSHGVRIDCYSMYIVGSGYRLVDRWPAHTQRTCIFCGHVWRTPGKAVTG